MRETLVWLGYADPADTRTSFFENDPEQETVAELLRTWHVCFGTRALTLVEISDRCRDADERSQEGRLQALFLELSNEREWNARKIGKMLSRYRDRVVGGLALRSLGQKSQGQRWQVATPNTPFPPKPPNDE